MKLLAPTVMSLFLLASAWYSLYQYLQRSSERRFYVVT